MSIEDFSLGIEGEGKDVAVRRPGSSRRDEVTGSLASRRDASTWRGDGATRGFSIIEMVGVLTIIVLLAAAATPTFIKRIDHETVTAERETLKRFSEALIRASVRERAIAQPALWPQNIASVLEYSPNLVSTNTRRFQRKFVVHPDWDMDGDGTADGLPYAQDINGLANAPLNAKGMILSTIAIGLPDLSSITASDFNDIWDTPKGTKPTALNSSWAAGRAEDLVIERIEFAPLFHRVMLVNADPVTTTNIGRFGIQTTTNIWTDTMPTLLQWVNPMNSYSAYYMGGTLLSFYRNTALLDTTEILHEDLSYVYKNDKWGRRLGGSDEVIEDFGELVSEFLNPPAPPDPKFAATQRAVINAFYDYLWGFSAWAYGDPTPSTNKSGFVTIPAVPPFAPTDGVSAPNYPTWARVDDAQVQLGTFTFNLID